MTANTGVLFFSFFCAVGFFRNLTGIFMDVIIFDIRKQEVVGSIYFDVFKILFTARIVNFFNILTSGEAVEVNNCKAFGYVNAFQAFTVSCKEVGCNRFCSSRITSFSPILVLYAYIK